MLAFSVQDETKGGPKGSGNIYERNRKREISNKKKKRSSACGRKEKNPRNRKQKKRNLYTCGHRAKNSSKIETSEKQKRGTQRGKLEKPFKGGEPRMEKL